MRLILLLLLILNFAVQAQINLQRPLERSVYQRNNQNIGWVEVKGTLSESFSKMEAKLLPFLPDQGTETDWQTITITGNQITGRVKGFGGFYNLILRGTTSNGTQITQVAYRVGIGEIFMVAGQSNTTIEGPFATDDRVLGVNYALDVPGYPTFIDLKQGVYKWIYPSGSPISFCGSLGDILVKKYNVPVLFMGAGAGGTAVENWYNSIQTGKDPFHTLSIGLQRICAEYGIRSILWHQGEANATIYSNTESSVYANNLSGVINESRDVTKYYQLSWAIARVSWSKSGIFSANSPNDPNTIAARTETISGQNMVIASVSNVFAGPETDKIDGYQGSEMRNDGVHFTYKGQAKHAEMWSESFDDNFWKNTIPFQPYNGMLKTQSINFPTLPSVPFDAPSFTPTANSTSGLNLVFKIISGPAAIEANKIILTKNMGTVVVEATQAGNDIYAPAVPVRQSFEVSKLKQTITFPTIPSVFLDGVGFNPVVSSSSELGVVLRVISGPATIESNKITLTKSAGTVVIEATQTGNSIYGSATPVRQSFEVLKLNQTIDFFAISSVPLDAPSFTPVASSNTGLNVIFKIISGPATIESNKITLTKTGVGTVIVEATQTGNDIYAPAAPVQQSFQVLKGHQTITFPAISSVSLDAPSFTPIGSSSSGLGLVFKIISGPATIESNKIILTKTAAGTVVVEATQTGNDIYNSAISVQQSFEVLKGNQSITFPSISAVSLDAPGFTPVASSTSGLNVIFKIIFGAATIESNKIILTKTGAGTVVVEATQTGNDIYNSAIPVRQSFEILRGSQNINFPIIYSKIFDKEVIDLKATSTSNLPVIYKIVSGSAKLTQNLLTIEKPSKITIEASQPGNDLYKPATTVQSSFDIFKIPQKILLPVITEMAHNTPNFELGASTNSDLGLTFKVISGPATMEGKNIKLTGQAGTVVVEVSQAGDDFYEAVVQRQEFNVYLLLGTENLPNIAVYPNPAKTYLNIESAEFITATYLVNRGGISQKIDLQKNTSTKYSLDISSIQPGFYVLRLQDKKNNYYHKNIIVE